MQTQNPFHPPLSEGIRRLGFRKWYERELLASHVHMALAVLAAVALLASLEAISGASPAEKLLNSTFVLLSGAVLLWSLRRYTYLLLHAEQMANQANCSRCKAYGQLNLSVRADPRSADTRRLVPVCCKRCGFEWDLDED